MNSIFVVRILLISVSWLLTLCRYADCTPDSYVGVDFAHLKPIRSLSAFAELKNREAKFFAFISFVQEYYSGAPVNVTVRGLLFNDEKPRALHIHRWGNLTEDCVSTGPDFNPDLVTHGGPMDYIRHAGDLGNIKGKQNAQNFVPISFLDYRLSLFGRNSIIGRSAVIHDKQDDFGKGKTKASQRHGNAGDNVLCGVIGRGPYRLFDVPGMGDYVDEDVEVDDVFDFDIRSR